MAYTFRNGTNSPGNSVTTLACNVPTGATQGDFMIAGAICGGGSASTITPPSGWYVIQNTVETTNTRLMTLYRSATASEPASYTWTFDTRNAAIVIGAWTGSPWTTPYTFNSNTDTTANTSLTASTITPTYANSMLVVIHGGRQNTATASITPDGSMTERAEADQTLSSFHSISINDLALTTTAATGSKVATLSQTKASQVSHSIIVEPPTGVYTNLNNYQAFKGADSGTYSERIR